MADKGSDNKVAGGGGGANTDANGDSYNSWDHLRLLRTLHVETLVDTNAVGDNEAIATLRQRIFVTARAELATVDDDDIEDFKGDEESDWTNAEDLQPEHCYSDALYNVISEGGGYDIMEMGPGEEGTGAGNPDHRFTIVTIDSGNPMGQIFRGATSVEPLVPVYDGMVDKSNDQVLLAALYVLYMQGEEGRTIGHMRASGDVDWKTYAERLVEPAEGEADATGATDKEAAAAAADAAPTAAAAPAAAAPAAASGDVIAGAVPVVPPAATVPAAAAAAVNVAVPEAAAAAATTEEDLGDGADAALLPGLAEDVAVADD